MHRFYTGKIGTGILMILTLGGLGIWSLIDLIMIIVGSYKDKQGLPLRR
ncbi:MAG: NINE protein [Pannonibacter indicus]